MLVSCKFTLNVMRRMNTKTSYLKYRGRKFGPVYSKNFGKIRDRDKTGHKTGKSYIV